MAHNHDDIKSAAQDRCCDTDEKTNTTKVVPLHSSGDGHDHGNEDKDEQGWKTHRDLLLALFILVVLLVLEYGFKVNLPKFHL
jgi:Cd2+/Zn2+-exporting ATPase